MKIHIVILALFVVAICAHRHNDDEEKQVGGKQSYRGRRRNDNQIAANAEDAELEENSAPTEGENTAERPHRRGGCGGRRGGKRGEKKGAHKPEQSDEDIDVRQGEDEDEERRHHGHGHRHHGPHRHHGGHHRHHHHHNRTTTAAPTTTTTLPTSSALPNEANLNEAAEDNSEIVDRDP